MIIPCMNCTSAGECGGNVAVVEDGSVRVGWPGAPGWTTTGPCCAQTDNDKEAARSTLFQPAGRFFGVPWLATAFTFFLIVRYQSGGKPPHSKEGFTLVYPTLRPDGMRSPGWTGSLRA